jgi:hypothetical protein
LWRRSVLHFVKHNGPVLLNALYKI